MMVLRNNLRSGVPGLFFMAAVLSGLLALPPAQEARACWNVELTECFNQTPLRRCYNGWPFQSPAFTNRYWRRIPSSASQNSWGFQTDFFDDHMCGNDMQSLWCMGCPASNDPEIDNYVPNLDTYVTWGPFSLAQAQAAMVSFYLYCRSEAAQDSIYWGAATTYTLSSLATMNISGSYSGIMQADWQQKIMNLDSLRNAATGNPVSMLGQSTVYLFWRFKANSNATVNKGAFIDNITVAWDDGGVDLQAGPVVLLEPDSTAPRELAIGDTVFAEFNWLTCAGGAGVYPPFRVTGLVDDEVILDTVITEAVEGQGHKLYTDWWILDEPDSHLVRFVLDTLSEVAETNEGNNIGRLAYYVPRPNDPPDFLWITPNDSGPDTVDATAVLRWEAYDSLEEAALWFYTDTDAIGCLGPLMAGGVRTEQDGPDSLVWDTRSQPHGRVIYVFVQITDAANDTCIYAPNPIVIQHLAVDGERRIGPIPEQYYLEQNYPNPFNPRTEIKYGVAVGGRVTVTVFDLLGREVMTLVDGDHVPGSYLVEFDGTQLSSGVYLYTLTSPEGNLTQKMMLLK
ncbi:T9SS type A sorting domain-containing protein [bacterium]|nr:T9SS type A sorting domain-containing protein [bacterium]